MALSEVKIGLIGTGKGREIAAALQRQGKLRLTDVFDPCLNSAQTESQQIDAEYSPSLDSLLRRTEGVFVTDLRWMGSEPLIRAAGLQRSAFLFPPVFSQFTYSELLRLQHFVELTSTLMMPALFARWMPSTLRLRELTASKVQSIESLTLMGHFIPGQCEELQIIDWCLNVIQSECVSVRSSPDAKMLELSFRRQQRNGTPVTATITAAPPTVPYLPAEGLISRCEIQCRAGNLLLTGPHDIQWQLSDGPVETESLHSDRTAEERMFDLFGRRVVGGVVPVPDVADLIRVSAIRIAARQSAEEDRTVPVGHPSTDKPI